MTWTVINEVLNKSKNKTFIPPSLLINGQLVSDKLKIANHFNDFFINIESKLAKNIEYPKGKSFKQYLKNPCKHKLQFKLVNTSEIESIIDGIKPKSSYGYDNISTKLLNLKY